MITIEELGEQISEIINQPGELRSDGQCLDDIVYLLSLHKLYKPKDDKNGK